MKAGPIAIVLCLGMLGCGDSGGVDGGLPSDDAVGNPVADLASQRRPDLAVHDLATPIRPVDLAVPESPADFAVPPPPPLTTAVSVFVEPDSGIAPVLSAIKGAKASLHIELYLLTDNTIIGAIESAQNRGVDVKVILEQHPNAGSNNAVFNQLQGAGVAAEWGNPTFMFTHEKAMIIDGKTLWAMTMNLSAAAVSGNREYLLVDTDLADVAEAEAVFEADWNRQKSSAIKLVVSPENSGSRIGALITGAQNEIDIEWEEFSDNALGSEVQQRIKAGVKVKIVVPNTIMGTATLPLMMALRNGGAEVRLLGNPFPHAKLVLVDRARGFIGSENATSTSLHLNRELGVAWESAAVAKDTGAAFDSDFAAGAPL